MFEIKEIEYIGYAGATMGGISLMVGLNTSQGYFPGIDDGAAILSVVVPVSDDGSIPEGVKPDFRICSRMIIDGKVTHWGEDIKLSTKERKLIKKWYSDKGIEEMARNHAVSYRKELDKLFKLYDKSKRYLAKSIHNQSPEKTIKIWNKVKEVEEELERQKQIVDDLENRKMKKGDEA